MSAHKSWSELQSARGDMRKELEADKTEVLDVVRRAYEGLGIAIGRARPMTREEFENFENTPYPKQSSFPRPIGTRRSVRAQALYKRKASNVDPPPPPSVPFPTETVPPPPPPQKKSQPPLPPNSSALPIGYIPPPPVTEPTKPPPPPPASDTQES